MLTNDQLTDGGPSVTPELPLGVAGPPFGAPQLFGLAERPLCRFLRLESADGHRHALRASESWQDGIKRLYERIFRTKHGPPIVTTPSPELLGLRFVSRVKVVFP
jgi:hypothetical protein